MTNLQYIKSKGGIVPHVDNSSTPPCVTLKAFRGDCFKFNRNCANCFADWLKKPYNSSYEKMRKIYYAEN